MKLWIQNHRLNLFGALFVGLITGYIISLYDFSIPISAKPNQETKIVLPMSTKVTPLENDAYWKGRIDERLENLVQGQASVNKKLEDLECSITDIKIGAAKQGGIYGGIASIIVLVASLLGKGLFKSFWGKDGGK